MFAPIQIALSGLNAASTRMEVAASNIVNATGNTAQKQAYSPKIAFSTPNSYGGVDTQIIDSPKGTEVSLAEEIVQLKIAEHTYKANAMVIKVAAEVQNELLDII